MAKPTEESTPAEPTMAQVMARLADIAEENQRVSKAQLKQTAKKSNTAGPGISAFNPRGEKDFAMPELQCEFNMPFLQKPGMHGMDREEVELINQLVPGEYAVELNDASSISVNVIGRKNHATGKIESMTFSGPIDPDTHHPTPLYTAQNKQQFPSLRNMLRQMVQDKALGIMTIVTERQKVSAGELAVSVGE